MITQEEVVKLTAERDAALRELEAERRGHPGEHPLHDEPMDRQIILLNRQVVEVLRERDAAREALKELELFVRVLGLDSEPARKAAENARAALSADPQSGSEQKGWQPIETLDRAKMQFVLVHQDDAIRAHLWNPHKKCWESGTPVGHVVTGMDECEHPTHWMPLPDAPQPPSLT